MRPVQKFWRKAGLDQLNPVLRRIVVGLIGTTILFVGLLLIFLPGAGLVVILVGLAVLGSEFVWARRMIRRAKALGKNGHNYIRSLVKS
jgi:Putative transmembrane protein (PGPGW)